MEKELGLKYVIKDCSLGINLPVVGLLLINQNTNKIFFNLGSDVSPITSLERCLTEAYQEIDSHVNNPKFNENDLARKMGSKNIELDNIFRTATGCWPNSILYENESYTFKGFEYPTTKNDSEDLRYLIDKIRNLGLDLYVRDVSYLGFPAFNIYIPQMSNIGFTYKEKVTNCKNIINDSIINYFKVPSIFAINRSSKEELQSILQNLKIIDTYGHFSIFPYNLDEGNKIDETLLCAMISYKLRKYTESHLFMSEYINNLQKEFLVDNLYYYCVRDYIYLKNEAKTTMQIKVILRNIYRQELVSEVIVDLKDEDTIFQNSRLPNCFNCDKCQIANECMYIHILKVFKSFQRIQAKKTINQADFELIINGEN